MKMLTKKVPAAEGEKPSVDQYGGVIKNSPNEVELTEKELLNDIATTNRRISDNVRFFFWVVIVGFALTFDITFFSVMLSL